MPSNGGNVSYPCRVGCSGKLNPNLFLPYLFVSHSRHQLCSISDGPIWDCSKLFGQTCSHTPRSGTPWLKSFQRFWRPEKHCAIFDHPTCTVTLRSGACACCCCLIPFWERPIRGAFSCHFLLIGLRLNDLVDLILGYLSNHIFPWLCVGLMLHSEFIQLHEGNSATWENWIFEFRLCSALFSVLGPKGGLKNPPFQSPPITARLRTPGFKEFSAQTQSHHHHRSSSHLLYSTVAY